MGEELAHGRYRIEPGVRGRPARAVDTTTGQRVLLPGAFTPASFLDAAQLRAAARALTTLGDPRFVLPLSIVPLVLPEPDASLSGPDAWRALGTRDAADAALQLVELAAIAHGAGASIDRAMIDRDARGALRVRALAPLVVRHADDPRASLGALRAASHVPSIRAVIEALLPRWRPRQASVANALGAAPDGYDYPDDVEPLLRELAGLASEPARVEPALAALRAPIRPAPFDVDEAIALGTQLLASTSTVPTSVWAQQPWLDLAALLHRRACTTIDDVTRARADLTRAVSLDEHPEYLTTLALLDERVGDVAAASAGHDRAVARIIALTPPTLDELLEPVDAHGIRAYRRRDDETHAVDVRESFPARAARTLEARGAFRATQGDVTGAAHDLRASLAMHATPSAERRLARLLGG